MGTSKGYLPPTGFLWTDTKRAVTNMKRENFSSTSIGKALSRYTKAASNNTSYQQSKRATSKIGAAAIGFSQLVKSDGLVAALDQVGLSHLKNAPFEELYLGLMDYFSESNNTITDTMANQAIQECMDELMSGITNNEELENILIELNPNNFLIEFFSKHIEVSFLTNFAEKIDALCDSVNESIRAQDRIRDYIKLEISENYSLEELTIIDWKGHEGKSFLEEKFEQVWNIFELWSESK